jgi:hypothetical protein
MSRWVTWPDEKLTPLCFLLLRKVFLIKRTIFKDRQRTHQKAFLTAVVVAERMSKYIKSQGRFTNFCFPSFLS